MSGGQDAATALYVSSMAMRALPGAGCGLELRFFLRGGWRVSILRRRVGLAVSDCLVSPCCSRRRAFEEEFASGSARTINAAPLGKLFSQKWEKGQAALSPGPGVGARRLSPLTHSGSTQRPPGGHTLPAAPAPEASGAARPNRLVYDSIDYS